MSHSAATTGSRGFTRAFLAVLAALAALPGCGTALKATADAPTFVPPLPNRPRLQYLASFTGSLDIERKSGFEEFVVGKEDKAQGLVKPYGAVMLEDRLVVSDVGSRSLAVFDFRQRKFRPWKGETGGGKAKEPINLAVGEDGFLYVADAGRGQILVYGPDEKYVGALGVEGDMRPSSVAVRGYEVYAVDTKKSEVVVLDRRDGSVLRRIGGSGQEGGRMHLPTNVAVGPDGDLYVSEIGNFRIQRVHPDGTSVRVIGGAGDVPGSFSRPKGVAVDPDGRVYVVDAAFENVQIFDDQGRLLLYFGGPGSQPGNLNMPTGIEVTRRGLARFRNLADPRMDLKYLVIVVSQFGQRRISVFGYGEWTGPEGTEAPATDGPGSDPEDGTKPAPDGSAAPKS